MYKWFHDFYSDLNTNMSKVKVLQKNFRSTEVFELWFLKWVSQSRSDVDTPYLD